MSDEEQLTVRITYEIEGTVQGVGFRPTVYRLANSAGLGGWIQNRSGTVQLCLEGTPIAIGELITYLHSHLPSQAAISHIHQISKEVIEASEISVFQIIESESSESKKVVIPADLAICADCEKEIMDCENRRFGYPFTTCTNCGPRYTVVNDLPYDRKRTTLDMFPLCEECRKEYEDPTDRRFHAESTACPKCGPQLKWVIDGTEIENGAKALLAVRAKLASGEIVAIRGIGGYLLACDAFNKKTLQTLRQRKNRPAKPFAVMFRNLETVFKYCKFNPEAVKLLISPEAPIVILDLQNDSRGCFDEAARAGLIETGTTEEVKCASSPITDLSRRNLGEGGLPITKLAPDCHTLGAMVPYSPLHKLLFEPIGDDPTPPFEALVMTSGNRGGEPICITNEEAFERLEGIADCFLTHNREINLRNDDSLCTIQLGKPQVWRRARGYAPGRISISNIQQGMSNFQDEENRTSDLRPLTSRTAAAVLAMGAELKNTIAIGYGDEIVMSPHIGDLEAPEAVAGMEQVVECFPKFLGKKPNLIMVDLHPDMQSTRLGRKLAAESNIPVIEVQHHHAHAAACMGEHGLTKALALTFDGTGLGPDGTIWGAECFAVDLKKAGSGSGLLTSYPNSKYETDPAFLRLATYAPVPLPGGDSAVYHPIRQLVARYHNAGLSQDEICSKLRNCKSVSKQQLELIMTQCEKGINAPLTHAAGRLFDAVSIMLGIAPVDVSYEGQSAIALEGAAKLANDTAGFDLKFSEKEEHGLLLIDWKEIFANFAETDKPNEYALAFHHAVAKSAVRMIEYMNGKCEMKDVVLSGGVFMNKILTELITAKLADLGFKIHIQRQVPPNDGGIAFGQAVIGMHSQW